MMKFAAVFAMASNGVGGQMLSFNKTAYLKNEPQSLRVGGVRAHSVNHGGSGKFENFGALKI